MTKHLRFLFVMLLAMIWSAGWAQTTIWSEDWSGRKADTQPKDIKYDNVVYGNGNTNTRVLTGSTAGGVTPELILQSKDTWTVTIKDLKGCSGTFKLEYKSNKSLTVTANSKAVNLSNSGKLYTGTFDVAVGTTQLVLTFEMPGSKNARIDDVVLTATSASDTKKATTLSFNTVETEFSVEKKSEASFTAPTATVKDADGKVVEGAKITYASSNSNIASVDENGKVTFGSEIGTATITASYAGDDTYKPAESISYTITYSKIPTVMAWSQSNVSVNLGETFTAPTLTFTAHDENILEGKTIQYNSSDENVAMIDETGYVLPMEKVGSTTITATFAGDDTYEAASAEYTLNVIDPNKTDVTFDFTNPEKYGYSKPASNKSTDLSNGDKLESNRVTITSVQGGTSTNTRFFNSKNGIQLRIYTGAILTVNAPAGFAINRIDFTDDSNSPVKNFTFSTGELNSKTWTGLAKNLTMTVDDNSVFLKNMTVNLVKLVELDENSESNTIEAKTGVNVTLKRTMVKGEWNTICLPFEVSEKQAKDAFGEGVKIATLNKKSTGTTISFEDISILGIPASEPCLIKPSIDYPAEGYIFKDVTIAEGAIEPMEDTTDDSSFGFVGIYNKTDISTGIENTIFKGEFYAAFLGAGNKIYKTNGSGNKTKGFRAYFAIPNGAAASALRVVIDGTATSIKNIDSEVVESNAPVYNLQGQRVNGNNLTPGIYVKAGKKFVVK